MNQLKSYYRMLGGWGWGDLFRKCDENNKILWIINGIRKQPIS